jgi:hypothetical protein
LGEVKGMEIVLIVAEKEYKRLETTHHVRKDLTRDHWQQAAALCCTRPGEGSLAAASIAELKNTILRFGLKFHFLKHP